MFICCICSIIALIISLCCSGLLVYHYVAVFRIMFFMSNFIFMADSDRLQIQLKNFVIPWSCRNSTNVSHFSIVNSPSSDLFNVYSAQFIITYYCISQFSSLSSFSLSFICPIVYYIYSVSYFSLSLIFYSFYLHSSFSSLIIIKYLLFSSQYSLSYYYCFIYFDFISSIYYDCSYSFQSMSQLSIIVELFVIPYCSFLTSQSFF